MLGDFKGHYIEIIGWDIALYMYADLERKLTNLIFQKSWQKIALCVYREYAKRRRNIAIKHTLDNNRTSWENI